MSCLASVSVANQRDRQALSCKHVHHRQSAKPSPIGQLVGYEVQASYLVRRRGLEALPAMRRGTTLPPRLVPQRHALLPVQAVHQLLAYFPALAIQQHPDLAVALPNPGLCDLSHAQSRPSLRIAHRVLVCDNMALYGDFTPVLAKHKKSFNLIDTLAVGVDRIQRSFEPMRRQVEEWRQGKSPTNEQS